MPFTQNSPTIHSKQSGLTLIEMLVVAPLVILLIGVSLGYISSLTGQGLQTRQKNALAYTVQGSLDDMELTANQATSFLSQTSDVTAPQGKNNDGTQFTASNGANTPDTFIVKSAATTKSLFDPTRALIYLGSGNGCNEDNALYTYMTVYFVTSNKELYKRTILPNTAACATPYQQNSCAAAVMNNSLCKVEDEKLSDNVTAFSIDYLSGETPVSPEDADTVKITLTSSQLAAGQPISYTGTVRTTTTNPQADIGQPADKPKAIGSPGSSSNSNDPDTYTCSWQPAGNASNYNVRYRYSNQSGPEAWIDGPQNTTATNYQIDISGQRGKTLTCEVTANTPSGSVPYDPAVYSIPLWTNCLLENGWVNYGSPYASAQFYKSASNIVTLKGLVKSGTTTNGTRICQLPEGYRPDSRLVFHVIESGNAPGRIDITPDGQIVVVSGNTSWTNLSTISFATAGASWTQLTSSTSWVDYGSPYTSVKVTKDANGQAYIQGVTRNGTNTSGTVMYNLPSAYSSPQNMFLIITTSSNTTGNITITNNIVSRGTGSSYWSLQYNYYPTSATTTWQTLSLQNSWQAYTGWATPAYTKSPDNIVTLTGLMRNGTTTSPTVLATLPQGYRPSETVICDAATSSNALARIDILSNGNIIANGAVTTGYLSLAGCDFMADGS